MGEKIFCQEVLKYQDKNFKKSIVFGYKWIYNILYIFCLMEGIVMNKYEQRTNRKKEAIVNSALVLFREKGFKNTSIKHTNSSFKFTNASITAFIIQF